MEAQSQLNQTLCSQSISFSIWPPTQRTRDAVIQRLIETLSTPSSVLTKRYGTLSSSDASDAARKIEDEAYSIAAAAASASLDDGGVEVIQHYSKEMSKLMIDTVKAGAALDNDASLWHASSLSRGGRLCQ